MDFILKNHCVEYEEAFCELLKERGYSCMSGIETEMEITKEAAISICFDGKTAQIKAPEKTYLFRGLMSLVMELEKQLQAKAEQEEHTQESFDPFHKEESIHFAKTGAMLDCSRGCVMSVPAVKAWIRMQASVGMNSLMLYTEDTYEVPEYPYFGAFRGRYKEEELREMDQYAQMFGIELVPCIQTLGHLQQPLRWPAMSHMRDTLDILMVGNETVYQFIRSCLQQISRCFTTKRVHLGMDEAWTLGLGQYLIKNGFCTKDKIMEQHLARVMELCEEFGLEPMMWSDMFFRQHSPTEGYYDVPFDTDMTTKAVPPEKMALVYWDYYHFDEAFYRGYFKLHRQLTGHVIFAGGGWSWNGTVPNLKTGMGVTSAALRACKTEHVEEIVFTLWGDDNTETPVFSALGPVLLGAEYGFGQEPDEARVREKFEFLTGCSYDEYRVLGDFDVWNDEADPVNFCPCPSKNLFYQDVLMGLYDGQMEQVPVGEYYAGLCARMTEHVGACSFAWKNSFWHLEMDMILDYYQMYAKVLAVKADLGLKLRSAYLSGDKETIAYLCRENLQKAIEGVNACRKLREKLWLSEGRIFGWEVIDIRFRSLAGRMESAKERLEAYLSGEIDCLPELEEERVKLYPNLSGEKRHYGGYNTWIRTVSASQIEWA